MKLSEPHEAMIARYLRDVALAFDPGVSPEQCDRAVARIDALIRRQLAALRKSPLDTLDVQAVLRRLGAPADQAAAMAAGGSGEFAVPPTQAKWLGVCAGLAARLEMEPFPIRMLFLAGGIVTGPLAVMAYLLAYAEMVYVSKTLRPDPVDKARLVLRTGGVFLALVLLNTGTSYLLEFAAWAVERLASREMPPLGQWGWLRYERGSLFTLAFLAAMPLALLSGMPLAGGWDHTLKRVAQAIVAAYGIALSAGIAALIAGVLIAFAKDFAG